MIAVQAIMSMAFQVSGPFLPLYVIQLGVHPIAKVDLWSGAIASVGFLFAAILSPLWGGLADRVGRKAMVVRSTIAVCVFAALMGLTRNVEQLLIVRAMMGVFSGFSAAATALVATQVPEDQLGYSLGWMATGQLVGGLIGPMLGGVLADRLHDYRDVFFFTSAGALCGALTCALFVRETFAKPSSADRPRMTLWQQFHEVATHRALAPMFLVVLLAQVTAMGVQPIISLFVRSLAGNSPWLSELAGAAFAVTGLADLIASPLLGKRSDTIGYRRVLLISLAGVALFTIPQAWASTVWIFLALRFGVGLFLGGVLPTANAWIGRSLPLEKRGAVYGIISSATFLGMFAGPILGGAIASRFGFGAVFVTFGTLTLLNLLWVAHVAGGGGRSAESPVHP